MTFEQGRNRAERSQATQNAPQQNAPQQNAPQQNAPQQNAPQQNAPRHDAPERGPYGELLDAALEAARAAAAIVAEGATRVRDIPWTTKSGSDFVSEIDMAAEHRIRDLVLERVPGAMVVGEELSPPDPDDAARHARRARGVIPAHGTAFVVDPLDGTTNFLHGYPEYAVSIGVADAGALAAGVVLNVATGETFTATRGGGAQRDGRPIRVSPITDPTRALIGTGIPFRDPAHVEPYLRQLRSLLLETSGIRRAGSAALDLCDVACGRFEAFWELRLAPWDMAAGMLIVREAGGLVTDLEGRDAVVDYGPIVAGSPVMHAWLMAQLRSAAPPAAPTAGGPPRD